MYNQQKQSTKPKLLKNCTIYTGDTIFATKNILVANNKIVSLVSDSEIPSNMDFDIIDLKGKNIGPGLIDVQINGGEQFYFSHQPNQKTLEDIYLTCCKYGTPFILPTLISSPLEVILEAIQAVRKFREKYPGVLGMHLQGPFLNPKKKGAHNTSMIRKPTNQQLQTIIQKGKDVIKVITIAPQCLTEQQINMLLQSGIVVSLGHSDLNYAQSQEYFNKGIHMVTHLYNAMNQMGQRQCGTVGAVFDNSNVYASIIMDGGHCHYAAARIAYKQKGNKLFLISDSSFLGRKKQVFSWPLWKIQMVDNFYRDKQGNLAGAAISMPEAIKNAMQNLNISLQQALKMGTSRVAKAIKMQKQIGYIRQGYRASFIIFNNDFTQYQSLIL